MTAQRAKPSGIRLPDDEFVELHPLTCGCGGFAGKTAWDSTRRPCDVGAGPAIGIVVDTRRWRELGSPRSEDAFREALAVGPEARQK
jgi:hypothetical protein